MPFWKAPQPGIRTLFKTIHRRQDIIAIFTFHVNDVPGLVVGEVGGQVLHSLLLVAPGEHVSGATTVSSGVAHLEVCLLSGIVKDDLN